MRNSTAPRALSPSALGAGALPGASTSVRERRPAAETATRTVLPLTEEEQLGALKQAMSTIGMTLMRNELSAFERALIDEVQRLTLRKAAEPLPQQPPEDSGPWWVAGQVIVRDDKDLTIQVLSDRETPEQQRKYSARLCGLLNRTGSLLD